MYKIVIDCSTNATAVVPLTDAEIADAVARKAADDASQKLLAVNEIRKIREHLFSTLAGIQAESICIGDTATCTEIVNIQQLLRDLTKHPTIVAATNRDEVRIAFTSILSDMMSSMSLKIKSVFTNVTL